MSYDDLKKIARALKVKRLRTMAGMDDVAVALNANPTDSEIFDIKKMVETLEEAGYKVVLK